MSGDLQRAPIEGSIHEPTPDGRPVVTVWHVTDDITPAEVHKLGYDLAMAMDDGRFEVSLLTSTIEIGTDIVGVGHPGVVVFVRVYGAKSIFVAGRLDIRELR